MKLLVFAQIPPPLHGQSVMVAALVAGLRTDPAFEVHHVNPRLSHDTADIGRWRPGKIFALLAAIHRALHQRIRHGPMMFYYVPAPGKRGALYRDWLVMLFCRPFFGPLVLHWHASGLGAWLATRATAPERWLTQWLLGRANLSIVLTGTLQADAHSLHARQIAIVPNGIDDPVRGEYRPKRGPFQVFFLGLCSEPKGLFAAAEAVLAANHAMGAPPDEPGFTLVAAGTFPDLATDRRFRGLCAQHAASLHYAGPVEGAEKARLFQTSHCFCLPTRYPAEGQPLVLLEAMAYDLPVISTRWRGIPDMLPPEAFLVEADDTRAIAHALVQLSKSPPPAGTFRRHFLTRFTTERHLAALAAALRTL